MPCSARASGKATPPESWRSRTSSGFRALAWGEGAHDFKGADHVQGAVEPAAVRDGVYVATYQDGPLGVAGCGGPDVAGLVGLYLGDAFYLFELTPEPFAGFLPLVGPGDAAGAVGAAGEVGQPLQFLDGA